jgi:ATP-dependent Lhr-like helicase
MTTSLPPSGSDSSSSFALLHERVRRWIWDQRWQDLRDVQETSIRTLLGGDSDAIITAATAAGKTEAAFLPICSALLADEAPPGVQVLYVGPLKALINDQWRRLDALCESLEIPVHRWHGDVTATARRRLVTSPAGILLITPESLEALFVRRGTDVARIFAALQFVVIDELHAFIGSERGIQLQSLLHRIERVLHRTVRRIGLSATLGDMNIAADFLRPPNRRSAPAAVISSKEEGSGVKLRLFGFRSDRPPVQQDRVDDENDEVARFIAAHLFKNLRGANNLVFANSRGAVERYTDLLARTCADANLPQEFFAHHGSLSRELRFLVEDQLKRGDRPLTVICTSTLEMGIDIGAVKSVAQIEPPPSVAALRQRLGRSGRRGESSVLRIYIEERAVNDRSAPQDAIRAKLVQTVAMVNLLLAKWIEPPLGEIVHASTLVQQLLSLIAQYGGITAADAYAMLCESGPFLHVDARMFMTLLRQLAAHDLIRQQSEGLLLHGAKGEKAVNHYDFYTAFVSPDEYRLMAGGSHLGTLPIGSPITEGSFLIFAGRRWRIVAIDEERRVIDLTPAGGGRVPIFDAGGGGNVHDLVRREMLALYLSDEMPSYLDTMAADLLHEGRENFRRYGLDRTNCIRSGDGAFYFPWVGDLAINTLVQQLGVRGLTVSAEGPAIVAQHATPEQLADAVTSCESERPIDTVALAAHVKLKREEKWDWSLDEKLLDVSYASRKLPARPARPAVAIRPDHNASAVDRR